MNALPRRESGLSFASPRLNPLGPGRSLLRLRVRFAIPRKPVVESALVPGWCPLETPAMKDDDGDGDAESRDSDASLLLGNAARVRVKSLKVVGRQLIDGGTLRKPYLEYQLSVQLGNQVRRA